MILLGSRDLNRPRDRGTERGEAPENATESGPGGLLVVEATGDGDPIRLEVFPDCSGPWLESRRWFALEEGPSFTRKPPGGAAGG